MTSPNAAPAPAPDDDRELDDEPGPVPAPSQQSWLSASVGIVILVAYLVLVGVMISLAEEDKPVLWSRRHEIFGGVEALALAAAGFFFGREVHRARAESAEQRADDESRKKTVAEKRTADAKAKVDAALRKADAEAAAADTANENGRRLTRELLSVTAPQRGAEKLALRDVDGASPLNRIATMAEAYFPVDAGPP